MNTKDNWLKTFVIIVVVAIVSADVATIKFGFN